MEQRKYNINGVIYIQRPLVLGQISQMVSVIEGLSFTSLEPLGILLALEDRITRAMAIVLTPEGTKIIDKDIDELADTLFECPFDTTLEVVADFFVCNPTASLLEKLAGTIRKVAETIREATGSKNLFAFLPPEISASESKSSGVQRPNRQSRTSNIKNGK